MTELNQEQENTIHTWTEIRDSFISGNTALKIEQEQLILINKQLSDSNTEIANKVRKHETIMAVAHERETERENTISKEIFKIEKEKTLKEVSLSYLIKEFDVLLEKKSLIINDIELLEKLHKNIFGKVSVLDKVVDYVTRTSEKNVEYMNKIVDQSKKIVAENIS